MNNRRIKTASLTVPDPIREFLEAAATRAHTNTAAILEATLGAKPITAYPEARTYTDKLDPGAFQILEELDRLLRTANPGSQLVFRREYIGYRRFDKRQPSGAKASRSQIYVSLLPRQTLIRLVLPVDPTDYSHIDRILDLSGKGHHGVGDTAIDVRSVQHAQKMVDAFDAWLGPPPTDVGQSR